MKLTGITPILNVSDVPASIAWFLKIGWKRGFSWNEGGLIEGGGDSNAFGVAEFAGVFCDGAGGKEGFEVFLCHNGQGSRGGPDPRHVNPETDDTGGAWMSWWVENASDVDAVYALAMRQGIKVSREPRNEPWNVRECHIVHPDGHTMRISAATCG